MNIQSIYKRRGEVVTFTSVTNSGVDENGNPISVKATVNGRGFPFSYTADEINGTSILSTDIKLNCTADQEPKQNWKCLFRTEPYAVISVNPVSRNGINTFYIVQLRK